jgi:hypothetical protein
LAREEISSAALVAVSAMSAVPADAHPLPWRPADHARANRVNHTRHFMPRNSWVRNSWKQSLLDNRIAVTNAASLHFDADRTRTHFGNWPLDNFKIRIRLRNLCDAHGGHSLPPNVFGSVANLTPAATARAASVSFRTHRRIGNPPAYFYRKSGSQNGISGLRKPEKASAAVLPAETLKEN